MCDIDMSDHVAICDIPGILPRRAGRKIHVATVYRWISQGVRGRRLPAVRVGDVLYVAKTDLQLWISPIQGTPPRTNRGAAIKCAEQELADAGI